MLEVKPIDRKTVDLWPIPEAGFPSRVVRCAQQASIADVAELRQAFSGGPQALPGLGIRSRRAVEQFFALCNRLELGISPFPDLQSLFADFLSPVQRNTLDNRYGLTMAEGQAGPARSTLQKIGDAHHFTRERARQVELAAKRVLASRLAQACLQPATDLFLALLHEQGVAAAPAFAPLAAAPFLTGYAPAGVLQLLCDCGQTLSTRRGLFMAMAAAQADALETSALNILRAHPVPTPADKLAQDMNPVGPDPRGLPAPALLRLLGSRDDVSVTADGRCFITHTSAPHILARILEDAPSPLHFRTLLREYNALVSAGCRKGPGWMLAALQADTRFARAESGFYRLTAT